MRLSQTYAIRGFLAFVAFMELVNALRSLVPSLFALPHERLTESFIQKKIFSQAELSQEANLIVGELFGFYSLLNSAVLVHTAFFSHLKPLLSLGLLSLTCKCSFYLLQGTYYSTIPASSYQVPLFLSLVALCGLIVLLWCEEERQWDTNGENEELLKAMKFSKAKKKKML